MLTIDECTEVWKLCPEASMEKFDGDCMIVNYSNVISQTEINSDIAKLERVGYIATVHGNGLKIRKKGI